MLRFKQFLMEGVVDQINLSRQRASLLGKDMANTGESTAYSLGGKKTLAFVVPESPEKLGSYSFRKKDFKFDSGYINPEDTHVIKVHTDNPLQITNPSSQQNSTLRHELQHLWQRTRQLQDNPKYAIERLPSQKFNNIRLNDPQYQDLQNYFRNTWGKNMSYTLDPQEVNARGIQRAGDAIEQHNRLARSKITSDPRFADYALELEKSRGTAKAPKLNSNIGRSQADLAFQTQMGKENEYTDFSKMLPDLQKGDVTKITKDTQRSRKAVAKDIAMGLHSNVQNAQEIAQDAYDDMVIRPQRERATRVMRTQAEVEAAKSARMAGGFGFGSFASDPISTSNLAMDVAGAMGDSRNRSDQMRKASASLYNPMYSDSEQMMGDALLRGGGEEFAVDPTFLRVADQRRTDRKKEKSSP